MPRAVQRATAADVPYSMSSGCATTQSTRVKSPSGNGATERVPSTLSLLRGTSRVRGWSSGVIS